MVGRPIQDWVGSGQVMGQNSDLVPCSGVGTIFISLYNAQRRTVGSIRRMSNIVVDRKLRRFVVSARSCCTTIGFKYRSFIHRSPTLVLSSLSR